jgi:RNA polymerase sigma-70 factor (ECF subfamily)
MDDKPLLAQRFEASRAHLRSVAYRMLGSSSEAEDAVQEAWLRLAGTDSAAIENLRGWLTTVVARVCLDMLRGRGSRREEPIGPEAESVAGSDEADRDALLADSVGVALLVVLEALSPAERVAYVLHDLFDLSFDDIAPIVERSPTATRQLASRARRRVQGSAATADADAERKREIVGAFMAASRGGDFSALLAVLDPQVVLRADASAVAFTARRGGPFKLEPKVEGSQAVGKVFFGQARAAQIAWVDGEAGMVFAPGGKPFAVFEFVVEDGRIVEIGIVTEAKALGRFNLRLG